VRHQDGRLQGAAGVRIFWQAWLPEVEPRALVVIAHGASEHSGRYEHVAARLVAEGYAVYAIEHRGHGRSEGPRALIDRMSNAVADLDSLVRLAAGEHPGSQVFLLGHSMGGTVALCYTIQYQDSLAGLILSGPLAALEAAPAPMRVAGKILSVLAPRLPLIAIDASLISRDDSVVAAYRADPLVHHGKLPARTVAELATAIQSFPDAVGAIEVPTLVLYGTSDRLCPPAGSVMLGERIGSADMTLTAYDGLYHEILNEPERERVLADICAWLGTHVTPAAAQRPAGSTIS
jgi:acylglycerol lipase